MGLRQSKKNLKSLKKHYKQDKQYFNFLRLLDTIYSIQDQVRLIKNSKSTANGKFGYAYDQYWGGGSQQTTNEIDTLSNTIDELVEEVRSQFDEVLELKHVKQLLAAVTRVTIKLLSSKGNKISWAMWLEKAMYSIINQNTLYNLFELYNYKFDREDMTSKPTKQYNTHVGKVTYVTKFIDRPTNKLKDWSLIVTKEVSIFIKKMMVLNMHCEWGTAFTWTTDHDKKTITIDKVYIMPVDVGGAHVQFVNESEYLIFKELSELGDFVKDIDYKTRFAGIMHSHHTMGSWHSSTDHGTIKSYVNDFKSVLSLVWSCKSKESDIKCDIILENKKGKYTLDNVIFEDEIEINDDKLLNLDSNLVEKYVKMIDIVKADYGGYKKLLEQFDNTKKYTKIEKLYKWMNEEESEGLTNLKELLS